MGKPKLCRVFNISQYFSLDAKLFDNLRAPEQVSALEQSVQGHCIFFCIFPALQTSGLVYVSSCILQLKLFAACVVNCMFHKTHHTFSVVSYFILLMFYSTTYYPKDFLLCGRTLSVYTPKRWCYLSSQEGDDRLVQETYGCYSGFIFR